MKEKQPLVKVVEAKELGVNCWSPLRFFNKCNECERYKECKYPEKATKK